jgi:hypothetical protein
MAEPFNWFSAWRYWRAYTSQAPGGRRDHVDDTEDALHLLNSISTTLTISERLELILHRLKPRSMGYLQSLNKMHVTCLYHGSLQDEGEADAGVEVAVALT